MPGKYQQILTANGLANVKAYIYGGGQFLPTDGGDYPEQQVEIASGDLSSWMGTPIFNEVRLESQDRSVSVVLDTVLIEINQSKNIVRTSVAGHAGTVKEYVSMGDYYIVLKGGVYNQDPQLYPAEMVNTLIELLNGDEALVISSDFLQLFDVFNFVVSTYNMPQRSGLVNGQLFEIRGYNDEPLELTIDDEA